MLSTYETPNGTNKDKPTSPIPDPAMWDFAIFKEDEIR